MKPSNSTTLFDVNDDKFASIEILRDETEIRFRSHFFFFFNPHSLFFEIIFFSASMEDKRLGNNPLDEIYFRLF